MTGTERNSARWRSLSTTRSRASLAEMSPVSSIVTFGMRAARLRARSARSASSRTDCVDGDRRRATACLVRDARLRRRRRARLHARADVSTAARKPLVGRQVVAVQVAVLARRRPVRLVLVDQLVAARGLADCAVSQRFYAGRDAESRTATTTKTSQSAIARHGRRVLQRAIPATERTRRAYAGQAARADRHADERRSPRRRT